MATRAFWSSAASGVALLAVALATAAHGEVKIDSNTFGGLTARPIGPAVMGGRIAALDATSEQPHTIYVGAATGGVWKSADGGMTFRPVFDEHNQSIGAITIDPSNAETVWVGTGETWARNSVSVGDGLYRTTDAGDTWEKMGLGETERIVNIRVHPTDGETVFVCATGHLWDANEERGVFKTSDGGATWDKVLYVDENTGCSWLAMDPQSPDLLYAGMWQFRRYPDFFESGGPGSGLYRSADGGASWEEIRNGLPGGELGRIAVEVAPGRPSTLYAVVEAEEKTALYRSQDLGATWEERNSSMNVAMRPFYFALVVVDPEDHDIVYKPGFTLSVSRDGGKSFTSPFGGTGFSASVHPDLHALWINPDLLFVGTEFGLYLSVDGGQQWARFTGRIPRVPVHDIKIHPRESDLIVGSHGRGIYILDDITPLRALTSDVLDADLALLPSRPATMYIQELGGWFGADADFLAPNPPEAASIYYYQKKRHLFGDLLVEIYDHDGELIVSLPAPKRKGINRVTWPMRLKPPKLPPATNLVFAFTGPRVAEGNYDFKLVKGKNSFEGQVVLERDPRSPHTAEDRSLQQATAMSLYESLSDLTYVVETIIDLHDQAEERATEATKDSAIEKRLTEYAEQLDTLRTSMVSTSEAGWLSGDEKLREKLGAVFGGINNYEGRPTGSQMEQVAKLQAELEDKTTEFDELTGDPLDDLNAQLEKKKLVPIALQSRQDWEAALQKNGPSGLLGLSRRRFREAIERSRPGF